MTISLDPVTKTLEKSAWVFWTILWISLASGLGQNEMVYISGGILEPLEILTILVVIVMWLAVVLQTLRQLFYATVGVQFVRWGRWLLLGASSVFAFRTTWMLVVHGSEMHISPATLFGAGLLGLGLCFNAWGRMQEEPPTYNLDIEEAAKI